MAKAKDPLAASMRVIKTASCGSISGKARLTYQIGCTPNSDVYLRITANTGGGFFSQEWVALEDIQKALEKSPEGQPITSFVLQPLLRGKSSNTPAFVMAALTHEKWLRILKGKKRGHEILDAAGFMARVEKLVSSAGAKKSKTPARKTAKKAPAKKKASRPRRKKATAVRGT